MRGNTRWVGARATRSRRARTSARRVWTERDTRACACHRGTRPECRVPRHAELPARRAHPRGHRPVSCGVPMDVVHRERDPQHDADKVRGEDGGRPLPRGALYHLGVGGDVVVHRVHRARDARARVCPAHCALSSTGTAYEKSAKHDNEFRRRLRFPAEAGRRSKTRLIGAGDVAVIFISPSGK